MHKGQKDNFQSQLGKYSGLKKIHIVQFLVSKCWEFAQEGKSVIALSNFLPFNYVFKNFFKEIMVTDLICDGYFSKNIVIS